MIWGFLIIWGPQMENPINESQVEQMKVALLDRFPKDTPILGSALGSILIPFIAPNRFSGIGGLKAFVSKYLHDTVVWVGRTSDIPGDDKYQIIGSRDWVDVNSLSPGIFWSAFSNPYVPGRFSLSSTKDILCFCSEPTTQIPTDWQEVSKVTEDDYRELARDFIASLDSTLTTEASNIVSKPGFNASWIQFLKSKGGLNSLRKWEKKRIDHILVKFRKSLEDADCAEKTVSELESMLVNSRDLSQKRADIARTSSSSRRPYLDPLTFQNTKPLDYARYNRSEIPGSSNEDAEFRDLMHKAIDRMSLDELRALRVPIGIILDLVRKS
jgi:hypothetical protein